MALRSCVEMRCEVVDKWLKVGLLAALLMGAGYFFGTVCTQMGQAYTLILAPSGELLPLLLRLLLALGAVAVTAGLVAALVRPVWVGIAAFALSGVALLLGWQVTAGSGLLVLVYLLAASICAVGIAKELNQRTRFSVQPVCQGNGLLLTALVLVACGSLYLGYAAHVEREGLLLPESTIDLLVEQVERQIASRTPAEQREEVLAEFRQEFRRGVDQFLEHTAKPYQPLIPLVVAAGMFMPLVTITRLLAWVPMLVLGAAFRLLRALGIARIVTEVREVERLVVG